MKYGFIECSTAVEAVEIMAKLDREGVWNDICYHYNDQEGLWIKFEERQERDKMNIIKWIDQAKKSMKICSQIKAITDQPIRGEMARIKAIKDIRTIMREV